MRLLPSNLNLEYSRHATSEQLGESPGFLAQLKSGDSIRVRINFNGQEYFLGSIISSDDVVGLIEPKAQVGSDSMFAIEVFPESEKAIHICQGVGQLRKRVVSLGYDKDALFRLEKANQSALELGYTAQRLGGVALRTGQVVLLRSVLTDRYLGMRLRYADVSWRLGILTWLSTQPDVAGWFRVESVKAGSISLYFLLGDAFLCAEKRELVSLSHSRGAATALSLEPVEVRIRSRSSDVVRLVGARGWLCVGPGGEVLQSGSLEQIEFLSLWRRGEGGAFISAMHGEVRVGAEEARQCQEVAVFADVSAALEAVNGALARALGMLDELFASKMLDADGARALVGAFSRLLASLDDGAGSHVQVLCSPLIVHKLVTRYLRGVMALLEALHKRAGGGADQRAARRAEGVAAIGRMLVLALCCVACVSPQVIMAHGEALVSYLDRWPRADIGVLDLFSEALRGGGLKLARKVPLDLVRALAETVFRLRRAKDVEMLLLLCNPEQAVYLPKVQTQIAKVLVDRAEFRMFARLEGKERVVYLERIVTKEGTPLAAGAGDAAAAVEPVKGVREPEKFISFIYDLSQEGLVRWIDSVLGLASAVCAGGNHSMALTLGPLLFTDSLTLMACCGELRLPAEVRARFISIMRVISVPIYHASQQQKRLMKMEEEAPAPGSQPLPPDQQKQVEQVKRRSDPANLSGDIAALSLRPRSSPASGMTAADDDAAMAAPVLGSPGVGRRLQGKGSNTKRSMPSKSSSGGGAVALLGGEVEISSRHECSSSMDLTPRQLSFLMQLCLALIHDVEVLEADPAVVEAALRCLGSISVSSAQEASVGLLGRVLHSLQTRPVADLAATVYGGADVAAAEANTIDFGAGATAATAGGGEGGYSRFGATVGGGGGRVGEAAAEAGALTHARMRRPSTLRGGGGSGGRRRPERARRDSERLARVVQRASHASRHFSSGALTRRSAPTAAAAPAAGGEFFGAPDGGGGGGGGFMASAPPGGGGGGGGDESGGGGGGSAAGSSAPECESSILQDANVRKKVKLTIEALRLIHLSHDIDGDIVGALVELLLRFTLNVGQNELTLVLLSLGMRCYPQVFGEGWRLFADPELIVRLEEATGVPWHNQISQAVQCFLDLQKLQKLISIHECDLVEVVIFEICQGLYYTLPFLLAESVRDTLSTGGDLSKHSRELFAWITGAHELSLAGSRLTAVPEQVLYCGRTLTSLDLSGNALGELPSALSALSLLRSLNLNRNDLISLPSEIASLRQLQVLRVSDNRLTSLPLAVAALTELAIVELERNPGLPEPLLRALGEGGVCGLKKFMEKRRNEKAVFRHLRVNIFGAHRVGKTAIRRLLSKSLLGKRLKRAHITAETIGVEITRISSSAVSKPSSSSSSSSSSPSPSPSSSSSPLGAGDHHHHHHHHHHLPSMDSLSSFSKMGFGVSTPSLFTSCPTSSVGGSGGSSSSPSMENFNPEEVIMSDSVLAPDTSVTFWDFSGATVFGSMQQTFLAPNSLNLLVFDCSVDRTGRGTLAPVLRVLESRCRGSPCVIVGTHIEALPSGEMRNAMVQDVAELVRHEGADVKGVCFVSAPSRQGLSDLLGMFRRAAGGLPHLQPARAVPLAYGEFMRRCAAEAVVRVERGAPPVSTWEELARMGREVGLDSNSTLRSAAQFLEDQGFLQTSEAHVVLQPSFLTGAMASLLLRGPRGAQVVRNQELLHVWATPLQREVQPLLISILESFDVAAVVSSDAVVVPALMDADPPFEVLDLLEDASVAWTAFRFFELQYLPAGLMAKFVVGLMDVADGGEAELTLDLWQHGAYARRVGGPCLLVRALPRTREVEIRYTGGAELFVWAVQEMEAIITEWFDVAVTMTAAAGAAAARLPVADLHSQFFLNAFVSCRAVDPLHERLIPEVVEAAKSIRCINEGQLSARPWDEIGRGGFGVVYRANLGPQMQDVALKQLLVNVEGGDPEAAAEARTEFQKEIDILHGLKHPNVVRFFGVLAIQPPALVMQLAPGRPLDALLYGDGAPPLRWPVPVLIALEVARGVSFLHNVASPPVVHRDLKAANVVVQLEPHVHATIIDFGSAVRSHENAAGGMRRRVVVNPTWAAPELLRSDMTYTAKIDVYSFGVLLWELMASRPFFSGERFWSVIEKKIVDGEREEISPAWNPVISSLITQCWAPHPESRPQWDYIISSLELCLVNI